MSAETACSPGTSCGAILDIGKYLFTSWPFVVLVLVLVLVVILRKPLGEFLGRLKSLKIHRNKGKKTFTFTIDTFPEREKEKPHPNAP